MNTVNPFIQAESKVSETGFYHYIAEFNISDLLYVQLQDAWKFCYLVTVINNYSIVLELVLYLANSNFSGKCQITNIAKFNSTLIIRDLQYTYLKENGVFTSLPV